MRTVIIDNFLPSMPDISDIKLYDSTELYKINTNKTGKYNWPGKRSEDLDKIKPDLMKFFMETYFRKIDMIPGRFKCNAVIHLKTKEDMKIDEIHTDDDVDYSLILNLSTTNLNSGTRFYDKNDSVITESKFVQNRAIMFDSRYRHMATSSYGKDIESGRITLNAFFKI